MKTGIRLALLLTLAFALSFGGLSPARAEDEPPPADIAALKLAWDLYPEGSSNPRYLTVYGGNLYFSADASNGFGGELWVMGLPPAIIDIADGAGSSYPTFLTVYDGKLFFAADPGDGAGGELWSYDSNAGAQRVADIASGSTGSYPAFMTVYNNVLYFQAVGNVDTGYELWKYDPLNGAQLVADIVPGPNSSIPTSLVVYNNELYFKAFGNDSAGYELRKYNPTDGVQLVADICPTNEGNFPVKMTLYNDALYFEADGCDGTGLELWMYDPLYGAQQVADINMGPASSDPRFPTVYNGALYFYANGGDNTGTELWKYDPTNGADRVADIFPGSGSSNPSYMAVYDNALYFTADGGDGAGREIWMYNNTATLRVRSVRSQDGWVLESGENTSTGGTLNASGTTFNLGDNNQDRQFRGILSFNTASLPDNAVIVGATLKIRSQGLTGQNPFATHGNLLIDIIKGAFSGAPSLQTTDFQAAPGKAAAATIKNQPDINNWFTSILPLKAFPFINPTGTTQLRLRFSKDDNDDLGADFLRFFSADSASMSDFPMLEVKYYIP